jgi:hypothetical protein
MYNGAPRAAPVLASRQYPMPFIRTPLLVSDHCWAWIAVSQPSSVMGPLLPFACQHRSGRPSALICAGPMSVPPPAVPPPAVIGAAAGALPRPADALAIPPPAASRAPNNTAASPHSAAVLHPWRTPSPRTLPPGRLITYRD